MSALMKRTVFCAIASVALSTLTGGLTAAEVEPGFTSLFDGKTFDGWKPAEVNKETWKIEEGAFVTRGKTCHLFYVGDQQPFKNFDLKVDVKTDHNANGGIYFHTNYQSEGWPKGGFECQVNNTHTDWIRTGSLYGLVNLAASPALDNVWYTQEIIVQGNSVTVLIDGLEGAPIQRAAGGAAGQGFRAQAQPGDLRLAGARPGQRRPLQEHPREAAGLNYSTHPGGRASARAQTSSADVSKSGLARTLALPQLYLTSARICLNSAVPTCPSRRLPFPRRNYGSCFAR